MDPQNQNDDQQIKRQPSQPVSPTPSGKKESYVDVGKIAKEEGDDYWEKFSEEIENEKKLAELGGVEKVATGEVKLPEDVAKEMGIKPTVTAETPISEATNFSIGGASLDDNQITIGLTKPTSSGFRWLAEWFVYQLRKAHYLVKKVKGKIWRQRES